MRFANISRIEINLAVGGEARGNMGRRGDRARVRCAEASRAEPPLRGVKWETNCGVAGRNGSRPRLSLINSVHCAPLITAAPCGRGRAGGADAHTPGLPGQPRASDTPMRTPVTCMKIPDCQTFRNQSTVSASPPLPPAPENEKQSLRRLPVSFFVTRRKRENAHRSTKNFHICHS